MVGISIPDMHESQRVIWNAQASGVDSPCPRDRQPYRQVVLSAGLVWTGDFVGMAFGGGLDLIVELGKIASIGGIALGVFVLLFRDFIRKQIFPQLNRQQAYRTLNLFLFFVWSLAMAGLAAWYFTQMQIRANEASRDAPVPPPPPAQAQTTPPTQSARFYKLCIGEHRTECVKRYVSFDEHIGCSDPKAWAALRCSNNPLPTVYNNQNGNRCGYAVAEFQCIPR
jgi:hypothetical protein